MYVSVIYFGVLTGDCRNGYADMPYLIHNCFFITYRSYWSFQLICSDLCSSTHLWHQPYFGERIRGTRLEIPFWHFFFLSRIGLLLSDCSVHLCRPMFRWVQSKDQIWSNLVTSNIQVSLRWNRAWWTVKPLVSCTL